MRLTLQLLRQTLGTTSNILTLGFPVTIFTFAGFARLTNPMEALSAVLLCSIMAGLSWIAGQIMKTVVPE